MSATAAEVRHVQDRLGAIIGRFGHRYASLDWDELESLALVGLARAAQRFDPERGLKFSTLATTCILREWGRQVYLSRMQKRAAVVVSLDELPPGYDTTRRDLLADPRDLYAGLWTEAELGIDVERLLAGLPPRLAEAARLRWLEDRPLREVGALLGLTGEGVRQRLKRAVRLMRERVGADV